MSFDPQITSLDTFYMERIVFSEKKTLSTTPVLLEKIKLSAQNLDGSVGPLIFITGDDLYSLGLQKQSEEKYTFPLCMWSKKRPSVYDERFLETLHALLQYSQPYLEEQISRRITVKSPLVTKDPKKGPLLHAKVLCYRSTIRTVFLDKDTHDILPPLSLLNTPCRATAALQFESFIVGPRHATLQVKLYEAMIQPPLPRSTISPTKEMPPPPSVLSTTVNNTNPYGCLEYEEDSDSNSNSNVEEER